MRTSAVIGLFSLGVALAGCGAALLPTVNDTTTLGVSTIRDDESLTPQEKRDALADLGFTAAQINGLLRDERLGNQFGGELDTAIDKLLDERLSELTPDEIQAYGDASAVTTYTDEEAQALSDFFKKNALNTSDEVAAFLDDSGTELPSDIDEENLRGAFVDFRPQDAIDELP